MSRAPFHVRSAQLDDAEGLTHLWHSSVAERSQDSLSDDIPSALRKSLASAQERIVVAETGGVIIGATYLRVGPLMPLTSDQAVFVSLLKVNEEFRRRGVARALIEASVSWAEEHGAGHVVTITGGASRDTSRFLARLGLTPAASVRVGATAALRAKLPVEVPALVRGTTGQRNNLGQVLAARRATRRSQNA